MVSTSTFASSEQSGEQAKNIKMSVATIGGAGEVMGISAPVDISLIINSELVVAKNVVNPYNLAYSNIEVDRKYEYKEISQAKFTWLKAGKMLNCTGRDMPLYVQEGKDGNDSTIIYFNCK